METTHNIPAHVLSILDLILLPTLAVTTIVSLVILEDIVVNMAHSTLVTHYEMEQVVYLKTAVAMMLECHGSSVNFLLLQLETLKLGYAMMRDLAMKLL